jgi:hypothetical protein
MFAGFFVGLNTAFTLALRSGLPSDRGSFWARLARVLLGGPLFLLISLALRQALALVPSAAGAPWASFLAAGLGTFISIWGGLKLFTLLGLYRESEGAPAR